MGKFDFTKEDVERVYDEVERRIRLTASEIDSPDKLDDMRIDMLQGVYSSLMILSKDWPTVRCYTDVIENERWGEAYA